MKRPCIECGTLTPNTRCGSCERTKQARRNARRTHYHGTYPQRAAEIRATATHCWICREGERPGDPWQADHVTPGDPNSELRAAHRSCNASRGNATA